MLLLSDGPVSPTLHSTWCSSLKSQSFAYFSNKQHDQACHSSTPGFQASLKIKGYLGLLIIIIIIIITAAAAAAQTESR